MLANCILQSVQSKTASKFTLQIGFGGSSIDSGESFALI